VAAGLQVCRSAGLQVCFGINLTKSAPESRCGIREKPGKCELKCKRGEKRKN
jgi:hypothetical protein